MRSFGSDNHSGVHANVISALIRANDAHARAYGDDPWTARAEQMLCEIFGKDCGVYFVTTGSAANMLAVASLTRSTDAILCSSVSHLNVDECGGPETFTGCKLIALDSEDGKLRPALVQPQLERLGNVHAAQPKVISITQPNEFGLLYSETEVSALAKLAHDRGLYLHMDGARLSNACVAMNISLKGATRDLGVDILSFGGTKNGLLGAEAVITFVPEECASIQFYRKKLAQLSSKMRFVSCQFIAYLENELWKLNAAHANEMAALLKTSLSGLDGVELSRKVETNMVYTLLGESAILKLQVAWPFYADSVTREVRWVTSFDTTEEDIGALVDSIREAVSRP
jgi:threonine aldolase